MPVFQRNYLLAALRWSALWAAGLVGCSPELGGLGPGPYSESESGAVVAPGPGMGGVVDAALVVDAYVADPRGSDAGLLDGSPGAADAEGARDAGAGDARSGFDPGQTAVLSSPAFSDGAALPDGSTCAGQNQSPAFVWTAGPAATQSYALALSSIDAGGMRRTHWLLWDIDEQARGLPQGVQAGTNPANVPGARQANVVSIPSDVLFPYYRGPCVGAEQLVFTLYALSVATIPLSGQLDPQAVVQWIQSSGALLSSSDLRSSYP